MKTCVAYYSKTGNTKAAAVYLAEKLGAQLIALDDKSNYQGPIGFLKSGMFASLAKKANLGRAQYDEIAKYDRIVLATPVWAGKTTPAVNAVLAHADFAGKEVYVLTTQADPDCSGADAREAFYRKAVEAKNGKFVALFSLYGSPLGTPATREEMIKRVDAAVDLKP